MGLGVSHDDDGEDGDDGDDEEDGGGVPMRGVLTACSVSQLSL